MITGILIAITIIAIIVAYIVGRVHGTPNDWCPCPNYYCNDPYNDRCIGKICLYPTELKMREEQAYQKGVYEEKVRNYEVRYYPRTLSEQEIIDKLKSAMKPLDELKKELKI